MLGLFLFCDAPQRKRQKSQKSSAKNRKSPPRACQRSRNHPLRKRKSIPQFSFQMTPNVLAKSFTNTNIIENAYRNTRNQTKRVHRWDYKGKGQRHPERWLTYALLKAEKGFRKIGGYKHLQKMKEALRKEPSGGPAGQS